MTEPSMRDRIARRLMDLAGCEDGDDGFRACVPATCSCRKAADAVLSDLRFTEAEIAIDSDPDFMRDFNEVLDR